MAIDFKVFLPLAVIFISGCVQSGTDVTPFLNQLPAIQQFLEDHPNADIQVIFLDAAAIESQIGDIRAMCGEQFQAADYYKGTYVEGSIKMTIYVDEEFRPVCIVKEGEEIPEGYCGDDVCDKEDDENQRTCSEDCGEIEPEVCKEDAKVCPDGTVVVRDPENDCKFYDCPGDHTRICDDYNNYRHKLGESWFDDDRKCRCNILGIICEAMKDTRRSLTLTCGNNRCEEEDFKLSEGMGFKVVLTKSEFITPSADFHYVQLLSVEGPDAANVCVGGACATMGEGDSRTLRGINIKVTEIFYRTDGVSSIEGIIYENSETCPRDCGGTVGDFVMLCGNNVCEEQDMKLIEDKPVFIDIGDTTVRLVFDGFREESMVKICSDDACELFETGEEKKVGSINVKLLESSNTEADFFLRNYEDDDGSGWVSVLIFEDTNTCRLDCEDSELIEMCERAGGDWINFNTPCTIDKCGGFPQGGGCAQVITPSCDCGDEACWNGTSCTPNSCSDYSTFGDSCSAGTGTCQRSGTYVCNSNSSATEVPHCSAVAGTPTNETCDSLDNDCDGSADEGDVCAGNQTACNEHSSFGDDCYAGVGECRELGEYVCDSNNSTTETPHCNATPGSPSTEICDQKDNDCDGLTDEGDVCGNSSNST